MAAARGRRPLGSGTREAILAAAKRQFAEIGYPGTTMRSIAAEAGVDTRLVTHYFGSKQELFLEVVELPFDPATAYDTLFAGGREELGARFAEFIVTTLEQPAVQQRFTGLVRAATSEEAAAVMVRELIRQRLLGPAAQRLGGDDGEVRTALIGTQVVGLVMARYVVGVPPLVTMDARSLIAMLGPVFEHYLTAPLPDRIHTVDTEPGQPVG